MNYWTLFSEKINSKETSQIFMPFLQSLTVKMKEHTFIQHYSPAVYAANTSVTVLHNNSLAYSN